MVKNRKEKIRNWLKDKKNWTQIFIPALLLASLFITARTIDLDQYLEIARNWIWQFGPWGPTVFVFLYVTAMLCLFPGMPFTVIAALLFGSLKGFLVMAVATNIAAVSSFFVARYLARQKFERRLGKIKSFQKLKELVEKNQWLSIPFVRLMPFFPFAVNNYALGLTRITFWRYLLISEIIILPMNAVWVFGANSLYSALTTGEIPWWILGAAVAGGLFILVLGYVCKRSFGEEVVSSSADA